MAKLKLLSPARAGLAIVVGLILLTVVLSSVEQVPRAQLSIPNPFPAGNPAEGREAFIQLQCHSCHRVEGDAALPPEELRGSGAVLRDLDQRASQEVAAAITARSHSEAERWLEGPVSSMPFFVDGMTVRQLVDVVAYLRSFPAAGPPHEEPPMARPFE